MSLISIPLQLVNNVFATRKDLCNTKKELSFSTCNKILLEHEKTSFSLQHESTFSSAARKDTFLCHTERYSSLQHEKISFAIQKPYSLQYPKINISYMKKIYRVFQLSFPQLFTNRLGLYAIAIAWFVVF